MTQNDDGLIYLEPRADFDSMILRVDSEPRRNVYDADALIEHWAREFAEYADDEEHAQMMAVEWFEFNVQGAYLGEHTPIYVFSDDDDEEEDER